MNSRWEPITGWMIPIRTRQLTSYIKSTCVSFYVNRQDMELKRKICGKTKERQTERKKKKGGMQVHLPREIIELILLRIPAEYLVRFKAVCKDWFSLISSRDFVYAHLSRHGEDFQQILVCKPSDMISGQQYEICKSRDAEDSKFRIKQKQLQKWLGTKLRFEDTLDGLLLFTSASLTHPSTLYACNPVTRKCLGILLPKPIPIVSNWTLVHDVSIQKYKVIGITFASDICYTFTLNNFRDTEERPRWRELVVRQCFCKYQSKATQVSQGLHWLAFERKDSKPFLCSMDVSNEEFRETQVPFLSIYEAYRNNVIGIMGLVSVTDYLPSHNELNIWCLEDWEKCTWTKKYTTICEFELGRHVSFHGYPSGDASRESRMIIRHEKQIFVYDSGNNVWRKINFPVKENEMRDYYNFVHVNSLVKWG